MAADPSKGVAATDIPLAGTLPATVFVAFQLMFAIITVALISGAVSDRLKFGAWLVFAGLWATFVYFPIAHWVFAFDGFASEHGGWIANKLHAIDFAGGTAVHINSGMAGLMLAIVLAALAVRQTTGGKIDDTLDRTVAPASDPLAPVAPQGGDLTAPVVDGPAPPQPSATADDPLADVAN